ncbi:MAG: hypothetical protein ACI4MO_02820 [Christensenellales bacterium]
MEKSLLQARFGHIGKIFFNLAIASGVLSLICLLSPIITALYALIVFAVVVVVVCFTLGLIFLIAPDFISGLFSSLSDMDKILGVVKVLEYSLPIMTIVAVLATVMFIMQTHRKKMVVASAVLAIVAGLTWAFVASGIVEMMQ